MFFPKWLLKVTRTKATFIGFSAVVMWGLLAYFSVLASAVPPLQLVAMSFLIGGLVGVSSWPFRPQALGTIFSQKWQVWALNVGSLFGCHLLYFIAVRHAPVIEVSLISYLWPLLIVVFSALAPGETLKSHHMIGVALGLAGAFVVITKGQGLALSHGLMLGHLIALPYAILWASFSVLIRKYGHIPTDIVAGFCLACAALSAVAHFILEPTLWPLSATQIFAVIGLGVLPMGLAFYAWDFGMKHGDRIILGASAYAAPLLSTLVLIAAGLAEATWSVVLACGLIALGAVIAAKDMLRVKSI